MEEQAFPPDGIQVKLEVWRGMFHVFQSHEPLLPEAREWRVTVVD